MSDFGNMHVRVRRRSRGFGAADSRNLAGAEVFPRRQPNPGLRLTGSGKRIAAVILAVIFLAHGDRLYVVEANHNSILQVDPGTDVITRLYDPLVQDPVPIILARHGNSFYLGCFSGIILGFNHKLGPVSVIDEGYGAIVDLTVVGNRIYLLETFAPDTPWTPDTGRVIRRDKDGRRTVMASGLNFPMGMARRGNALYVSTASYGQGPVEGLGQIVRINLAPGGRP